MNLKELFEGLSPIQDTDNTELVNELQELRGNNKKIYQLMCINNEWPELVQWYDNKDDADNALNDYQNNFPEENYFIEEGTDHIKDKCRGCDTVDADEKYDAHGITTGIWCKSCYNSSKYPYRKDKYPTIETHGYGERLD